MDRRLTGWMAAALVVCLAAAVAAQQAAQPGAQADDEWVPETIKNLTVLPKDMPPADVMRVMRVWNEVLNVDCVFCHVGAPGKPLHTYDFVSDSKKRKEVTRLMVRGTMAMNGSFKELGEDAPQVSCATCHKRSRSVDDDLPPPKPRG
jgi:hypothetical protein